MDWKRYIADAKEHTTKKVNSFNANAYRHVVAMKYGVNKSKTLERWAYRDA